jgi:hypothetical protein
MAVRVELSDGIELVVRMTVDEMREAFAHALANSRALELKGSNGQAWDVNPNQILYFEEVDDATADELERRGRERREDARRGHRPIRRR